MVRGKDVGLEAWKIKEEIHDSAQDEISLGGFTYSSSNNNMRKNSTEQKSKNRNRVHSSGRMTTPSPVRC